VEHSIRRLCFEDEFLYLAFHLGVQHRFQKLVWLLDLARMRKSRECDFSMMEKIRIRAESMGMKNCLKMIDCFLDAISNSSNMPISMEKWFQRIASAKVEDSFLLKFRLRAYLQGGWIKLFRYLWARQWAGSQ
jgi:hypothetical protein